MQVPNVRVKGVCSDFTYGRPCTTSSCGLHFPEGWAYIDAHCHLDRLQRTRRLELSGIGFPTGFRGAVSNHCDPETYHMRRYHEDEPGVRVAIGLHPKKANRLTSRVEEEIRSIAKEPKTCAIGEIGLDFSAGSYVSSSTQMHTFQRLLCVAAETELPVVLHARDAYNEVFHMCRHGLQPNTPIHLHCFNANWATAERFLSCFPNLKLGFTGMVTGREVEPELLDVVRRVPMNRMVLETDAPYFAPGNTGTQCGYFSHPGHALNVAVAVASIKREKPIKVLRAAFSNTSELYRGVPHWVVPWVPAE